MFSNVPTQLNNEMIINGLGVQCSSHTSSYISWLIDGQACTLLIGFLVVRKTLPKWSGYYPMKRHRQQQLDCSE